MRLTRISFEDMPCTDTLFQSGFWAAFWNGGETESYSFMVEEIAGHSSFALIVLVRKGNSGERYAYVPRGIKLTLEACEEGLFLEQLSEKLAEFLPLDIVCIRYDSAFFSPYIDSEYWSSSGQWKGAPRMEIRELRMNYGTKCRKLRKSPLDHLSPDTVIVSLKESEEEIFARMRQTTRNSIRRAYRSGLEFNVHGSEGLDSWFPLYAETAQRKNFFYEDLPYFENLFAAASKFTPSYGEPPAFFVLNAEKDGEVLAGLVLCAAGKKGYYLYAGSSLEQRKCMPNYGLQWEAIKLLRSKGCTEYDLMGVPPNGDPNHSMYGLYTFKTGLGGKHVHYSGCWDFPLDGDRYVHLVNSENFAGI